MMEAVLQQNLAMTVKQEQGKLLKYIRSRIDNIEDAEDILQEVYLHAARSMSMTEPIENLLGWLYAAAHNRIVDWYRKKKHRTVSLDAASDDTVSLEDLLVTSDIDVEKELTRSMVMDAVFECLDELPESQREIFIQQAIEGRTFKEVSEQSGVSINTLLARKRYAVQFLRERLADMRDVLNELS
jgi:RNA polymerase sigma factor (sigma-70 family)